MRIKLFSLIIALLFQDISSAALADQYSRQVWRGSMSQSKPMSWSGKMELYIKFDPEADFPQDIEGVVTWPDLGMARTSISGKLTQSGQISFSEIKCLEGACDKVVLGGTYQGRVNGSKMYGSAQGPFGLQGEFKLSRVD